jgi:pseudouridine-5'-phosphate glycosidase
LIRRYDSNDANTTNTSDNPTCTGTNIRPATCLRPPVVVRDFIEVLETMGIPVVGYSTNEFPAFYSRESNLPLPHRVDTPDEAARMMRIHQDLGWLGQGTPAGMLIVNPPPAENALPRAKVQSLIAGAVAVAEAAGIRGKALTPFLLEQLARNSGGKTLQTNIALLLANARLAAEIAVAYSAREARSR